MRQQAAGLAFGSRPGPLLAPRRKPARQEHVVDQRQIGDEVEHLEHEADMVGAEGIARRTAQRGDLGTQDRDRSGLGLDDPAQQVEQRRLAAAARPADEQLLAAIDDEFGNIEDQRIPAAPAEADVGEADHAGRANPGRGQKSKRFAPGFRVAARWPPGRIAPTSISRIVRNVSNRRTSTPFRRSGCAQRKW